MTYDFLDTPLDISNWEKVKIGRLTIAEQSYFNNAQIILEQQKSFHKNLEANLQVSIPITAISRTLKEKKYKGINVTDLNKELRTCLKKDTNLLFELYNDDGIFYKSKSSNGFDFACINAEYNTKNLWNLCFGKKSLHNGQEHWNKSLSKNTFISNVTKNIDFNSFTKGIDILSTKKSLTILGELQFGNWALAYRDLFKLLNADFNSGVDLFIYVTAHNNLLSYSSDKIVCYDDFIKILKEFSNLIKVPVWVIGLDITI